MRVLPILVKEQYGTDQITPAFFFVLAKISEQDPKFPIKARSYGGLRNILSLMKLNLRNPIVLKPLMQVVKLCSTNSANCSIFGREGLVPILVLVLKNVGWNATLLLRTVLQTIGNLCKNSKNCKVNTGRFIRQNGIHKLLTILENWQKYGKRKHKICRANLYALEAIANMNIGRKAIIDTDGVNSLYKFLVTLPATKGCDALLIQSGSVLQKCLPKKTLPIEDGFGPFAFAIPYATPLTGQASSASTKLSSFEAVEEDLYQFSDEAEELEELNKTQGSRYSNESSAIVGIKYLSKEELGVHRIFFKEQEMGSTLGCASIESAVCSGSEKSIMISSVIYGKPSPPATNPSTPTDKSSKNPWLISQSSSDEAEYNITKTEWPLSLEKELTLNLNCSFEPGSSSRTQIFSSLSSRTRHVMPFVKLAHPDLFGVEACQQPEPLFEKNISVCRAKFLQSIERLMHPQKYYSTPVFSIDDIATQACNIPSQTLNLSNSDELRLGKETGHPHLNFESRFESGNLRKAFQIGPEEYDLILSPDINSRYHLQWFYFEVSNMKASTAYIFNIINCEKSNSQFNSGMQPLLYSVKNAISGEPAWVRTGTDICYYKNQYSRDYQGSSADNPCVTSKTHYSTTFTIKFPHEYDVCYIAYHYPYTYTQLMTDMHLWKHKHDPGTVFFQKQQLCLSLGGNMVPVLTITANGASSGVKRPYIFLTGRVHPGESNASWVMKGTIDFLMSDNPSAKLLRELYIFKIVPMLNPDGVINGNHRCDLTAEDLNRCWHQPCQVLQPTVYHTKALLQYLVSMGKTPLVYCDYHGHSRRKNIFLYGCSESHSWLEEDRSKPDLGEYEKLPRILHSLAPAFSLRECNFGVERQRESTGRVAVWRQFGVSQSYTMESSFCGCDQGKYRGMHFGIKHLEEMGQMFGDALGYLHPHRSYMQSCLGSILIQPDTSVYASYSHVARKEASQSTSSSGSDISDSENEFEPNALDVDDAC